jgi:uncharacterized oxidoreductase
MQLCGNTILITGGTSGIGLELATQLSRRHNTVIVTGRDARKLQVVQDRLPDVHVYQSDVSDPADIAALFARVTVDFPALNVLFNNAGVMRMLRLDGHNGLRDIGREVETNLLGPMRMVEQFLPILTAQPEAAIVNSSSGLAFVPLASAPIYCATKAAIHSYTESLREQLAHTRVKVFEVAPPPTGTPLMDDFGSASYNSRSRGVMRVDRLVKALMRGLEQDRPEIRPGVSTFLYAMSRLAPMFMLRQLSRPVARELGELAQAELASR